MWTTILFSLVTLKRRVHISFEYIFVRLLNLCCSTGKILGFGRYWMALDEDGMLVRWYKTEERGSVDCTAHMDQCIAVSEPSDQYYIRWPDNTTDRAFIIDTWSRVFYLLAESPEKRRQVILYEDLVC